MKKYIILGLVTIVAISSCRREHSNISKVVTPSYPTINFTGSQFYSIMVGGTAPTIQATAYDSALNESYSVSYDPSLIDITTPGLYVIPMTATSKYGYVGSAVVYVAVTDIDSTVDLSGVYLRSATGAMPNITQIVRGLYSTDDVGGAPSLPITAYFAQLDDSTLSLPEQPTDVGTLSAVNAVVYVDTGDTVLSWAVRNGFFGTQQRFFVKQ